MKPHFIALKDIEELKSNHSEIEIHNNIELFIEELFDIAYPAKKDTKNADEVSRYFKKITNGDADNWGTWVYYPWLNKCLHIPPSKELRQLRTSRNRNLITAEEQERLYEATIFIAGMSVGSNIVEALVSQGIGGKLILADMDIIEPSNLNRIRSPLYHIGLHKVEAISRKVWEMDPYIEIIGYEDGVNESVLDEIVSSGIDILIDEIDSLEMKIYMREVAQEHKLPVLMAADDGDDALIDVERYDIDGKAELFNGRLPSEIIEHIKKGEIPRRELGMLIGKYFVGEENIPLRMYQSLEQVGRTLPSWPQLGGAAALSGVSIAYAAKKIILGEKLQDGRVLISLDDKLAKHSENKEYQVQLKEYRTKMFGDGA